MICKIYSVAATSLVPDLVEIEADILRGLPKFNIVGLGDTAVQESKERVQSAIKNSGAEFPVRKITVNLAPGDIKKTGPAFDLPIALSLLIASGQISPKKLKKTLVVGELALDGKLRHINGVLPIALFAKEHGFNTLLLPAEDALEASIVESIDVLAAQNLSQVLSLLNDETDMIPTDPVSIESLREKSNYDIDMADIYGQEHAKRALEIAAAGGHNILFNGPPGSGKTLLARGFRTILPAMTLDESLEVTKIYSIAGLLPSKLPLIIERPFRTVHHSASGISIVGGGKNPSPGEISLAHKGVLFMDEFPEFPRNVLEVMRQPLEDGYITVSRVQGSATFPAQFALIAAMNPCPCGFLTDPEKECTCFSSQVIKYQKKISGPLLDRIDMFAEVPRIPIEELQQREKSESSKIIRNRVQAARDIQTERFESSSISCNKEMSQKHMDTNCVLEEDAKNLLKQAAVSMRLSGRAYFRTIKLARTIADLSMQKTIQPKHIAEALQYRKKQ